MQPADGPAPAEAGTPRVLVLTADERFWPDTGAVLFLGEWCKLYSRRAVWQAMDTATVRHPWHDFLRFSNDYAYLRSLYGRVLPALAESLNRLHACQHDDRYWQVLVGPWLATFLHIAFERWTVLSAALAQFDVSRVAGGNFEPFNHVPRHMNDFHDRAASDTWNGFLLSSMVRYRGDVQISTARTLEPDTVSAAAPSPSWKVTLVSRLLGLMGRVLVRRHDHFMISTYVPLERLLLIQMRLGQFPARWASVVPQVFSPDPAQRQWRVDFEKQDTFQSFVASILHLQLPTVFCEGYAALQSRLRRLPWPSAPRSIFTSNALWADEVVMAYAAERLAQGSRLLYGQHGGLYGVGAFSWAEEHEIAIADRYLTWGWIGSFPGKSLPVGYFKRQLTRNVPRGSVRKLVMVCYDYPRYTHRLDSEALVMLEGYIENCLEFGRRLPSNVREDLLIRLTPKDSGWSQAERWSEAFPFVPVDRGVQKMSALIASSRLMVYTYNSTGFLEAFASNVPCIMFWDAAVSKVRTEAAYDFDELKRVGILHDTPQSAAAHVDAIWDAVPAWWNSSDVQAVLQKFIQTYCKLSPTTDKEIRNALLSV